MILAGHGLERKFNTSLASFKLRAFCCDRRVSGLRAPLESLSWSKQFTSEDTNTLAHVEANHILKTVKEADWVIGGTNGAAKMLGLKRATLISKMRRLGLSRSREATLPPS